MAQTQSSLLDSFIKQSTRIRGKQQSANEHKGRMAIDFNKKAEEIYNKASKAGRKRKRSGLSKFLNAVVPIIVSIFNPIAGGVMAGVSAGNKQYQQGKFTQRQANAVKNYMQEMGLQGKYGKTFLRGNVSDLKNVKEGMNDLARAAKKMKSFEKILPTAAFAGVSTYMAGKTAQEALFSPVDAITATTPGASTAYMGAQVSPVVTNAAGTGAASLAQQLSMGLTKFAPFQGANMQTFIKKAMATTKDASGAMVPAFPEYAKALQSMMWMYQNMAKSSI
jgi:hypothetical protein